MEQTQNNVILVTIDCLRYDRCGFNGYTKDTTPFLDLLSGYSHVFDRAIVPGTWTSESFPGILAGRHGADSGYMNEIQLKALPKDAETVATQMGKAGYETIAVVSNPQLSSSRNFDIGFDTFRNLRLEREQSDSKKDSNSADTIVSNLKSGISDYLGENKVLYELSRRKNLRTPYSIPALGKQLEWKVGSWPTVRAEEVLLEFYDAVTEATTPFFGWTHLMDLHAPLHSSSVGAGGLSDVSEFERSLAELNRAANNSSDLYSDMYDSVLRYLDQQLESFAEQLKSAGIWDNTTIIVTSDHGEAMGERGINGHVSQYPYNEILHVPFLVHPAGGMSENRIDDVVSLSWLYEVIAEVSGITPTEMPAQSPYDSMLHPTSGQGIAISDSLREWGHLVIATSKDWKLVKHYHTRMPKDEAEKYEMVKNLGLKEIDRIETALTDIESAYNLSDDPDETEPLPVNEAPVYLLEAADDIGTDPKSMDSVGEALTEDNKDMLRDLGYL